MNELQRIHYFLLFPLSTWIWLYIRELPGNIQCVGFGTNFWHKRGFDLAFVQLFPVDGGKKEVVANFLKIFSLISPIRYSL
jgi:hypothetical protein